MIVKNGQIIAIGNVNTGGTLSGNGLSGSPLGLRDDAVKLTPASSGIDIKKIVAEDGKIEYKLGISADITVGSTIVKGDNGIKSELQDDGITYIVSVSGDYLTSADNSLAGKDLILRDNQWVELSAAPEAKEYSGGEGIKVDDHIISVSGKYYPLNTNPSGYLVKADLNEYAKSAWVDQEFQKKGNYITSAESSQDYLVLQDNTWVKMPNLGAVSARNDYIDVIPDGDNYGLSGYDWNPIIDKKLYTSSFNTYNSAYSAFVQNQFSSFSATVSATYIQSADIPVYSAKNDYIDVIPDGDNYGLSGYDWNPLIAEKLYTSSFESYSAAYSAIIEKQFSSFSATVSSTYIQSADIPVYSARNDYIKIVEDGDNYGVSGYDWNPELAEKLDVTAFDTYSSTYSSYVEKQFSSFSATVSSTYVQKVDIPIYSAKNDYIAVIPDGDNYGLSGYDWTEEIDKKQDELTEYQLSAISSVSAIQAFSGNWVTSATDVISEENLSYVLKKDGGSSKWEGVDLSEVGKTYKVESETPELLKVTSGDNNTTFTLSAKPYPEVPEIPSISGYGTSAWYDEPTNQYKVSANIVGINGISAEYDSVNNQWNIGASASNLAYLNTTFNKSNNETVVSGDIIKFVGGIRHDITVDDNGYITVPNTVDKLTICVNATIDNNIPTPDPHNYMLNQFVLSAVNGNAIVTTHDYYPSEVGAADSNIAATIQHYPDTKYCVVYLGSDTLQIANMNVNLSMIEEVISMSDNSGTVMPYYGEAPIYVNNQNVGLHYDTDFFTLTTKSEGGIQNEYLTLAQTSSGTTTPVDPEVFNKLLNSVNRRIVETIPIGIVNQTDNQGDGIVRSYLFRPMIEFDMKPGITARIRTYQKDANTRVQIAVYQVSNEETGALYPIWLSEDKLLDKDKGEHVINTHTACTQTRTIYPEELYYVLIKTRGGHVGLVGLENNIGHDTGTCDVAYYLTGQGNVEWNLSNIIGDIHGLGSDGQPANFKPYVGFRNDA